MRTATPILASLVLLGCGGCGERASDDQAVIEAGVRATLAERLVHEEHMLSLLESHAADPKVAARELQAYVEAHRATLAELCAHRQLLERHPMVLASAMAEVAARAESAFARRQRLYERWPALMAEPGVVNALAHLDGL